MSLLRKVAVGKTAAKATGNVTDSTLVKAVVANKAIKRSNQRAAVRKAGRHK